jgi:hypothetical protein
MNNLLITNTFTDGHDSFVYQTIVVVEFNVTG